MRVRIFRLLSEPEKRNIRRCCKQFKQEIDTLVGLNIKLCKPIESNELFEWIQSLRINGIDVRAETMSTSELMVLLQNRRCSPLKRVRILYPNNFDLIPVLTMLSGIDTLREVYMNHACKSYLGFLPISVYRFSRLRRMDIALTVGPEEISLGTAQFFLHIRCPQLQILSLTVCFYPKNSSIVVDQTECLKCSQWLLNMIEIFPSIQYLIIILRCNKFTPLYDFELGE